MKLHSYGHFTISRQTALTGHQRLERGHASLFFGLLPNWLPLDDVLFGEPDPPDFIALCQGKRIALELTQALPRRVGKKGYAEIAAYEQWMTRATAARLPLSSFSWEPRTLREMLDSLSDSIA